MDISPVSQITASDRFNTVAFGKQWNSHCTLDNHKEIQVLLFLGEEGELMYVYVYSMYAVYSI